jgi:succinate dehydrogenase/fumarate reductase cytochrome b subunit
MKEKTPVSRYCCFLSYVQSRQFDVLPQTPLNLAQATVLEKTSDIPTPLLLSMKTSLQRWSLAASALGVSALVGVSSAFAQSFAGPDPNLPGTPSAGGSDANTYRNIVISVITAVLNFLALVAVVVVIIAGIRLIVSQGNEEELGKAKKAIFYALIGLVIVLLARVIVGIVTNYLSDQVGGGSQ